jgi:hypothetical protein
MKIDNIKEEVTHQMERSEKRMKQKYKTQWKARLEQVEDRISELEDKMEIKGKNQRAISQTTQDL